MGANDRALEDKDNKRAKARDKRAGRRVNGGTTDWREFDWTRAAALTMAIADEGGALRIGRTRDGGAWAFGVYMGDDYATEYVRPSEDFAQALSEIAQAWLPDGGEKYNDYLIAMLPKTK